jgi:hypothetical protein
MQTGMFFLDMSSSRESVRMIISGILITLRKPKLNMGFERVEIPVRVKVECEVREGLLLPHSQETFK